ncbi:MAG TPA: hypothetical protein P5279_07715 [Anaerohalosphaeraceae bacterium]|jgi:hypothetical protein|nr:hypothetical protein [Anaerohalosphaeraceae bacterium]HRT50364.1 hypothetical protein [Anaerohalosphaeraceae bacterium]HRT86295.1 hypothetical protein [Anaerohalosphaeraceae bacterium]
MEKKEKSQVIGITLSGRAESPLPPAAQGEKRLPRQNSGELPAGIV